jgi:hypothetical protein
MTTILDKRKRQSVQLEPQFRFDEAEHRYYWGDREMSGVTSVLNKTLASPRSFNGRHALRQSTSPRTSSSRSFPGYGTLTIGDDAFWEKVLREARTAQCRVRDEAGEFGINHERLLPDPSNSCTSQDIRIFFTDVDSNINPARQFLRIVFTFVSDAHNSVVTEFLAALTCGSATKDVPVKIERDINV